MEFTCNIKMVDFGSLKALVSIQIEDLEIRGFKVIDQGEGKPWVASPSREILKDGKKDKDRPVGQEKGRHKKRWKDFPENSEDGGIRCCREEQDNSCRAA